MMDWTGYFAVTCLWIAGPLCIAGIFCHAYKDNWLQWFGLWGLAWWCFARASYLQERGYTDVWNLALYFGLAAYSVGTAVKVFKHARPGSCDKDDDLPEVGHNSWRHISGGTKQE